MKSIKKVMMILLTLACITPLYLLQSFATEQSRTVRVGWYTATGMQDGTSMEDIGGYNYEYLCRIAQYENWNLEFVFGTWSDLEQALIDGRIDVIGDVGKSDARMEKYDYGDYPAGNSHMLMVCRLDDDRFSYDDYASFDGILVGDAQSTFRRGLLDREADAHGVSVHYKEYNTEAAMLTALDVSETDAAILSNVSTYSGYKVVSEWEANPFYFVVSKHSDGVLDELNDGMRQIQISDIYLQDKMFEKYFGENGTGSTVALTKSEKEYLAKTDAVTVLLSRNQKPFSYEENGAMKGLIPDYMSLLSEKTGLKFQYVVCDHFQEISGRFQAGDAQIFAQFPDSFPLARDNGAYLAPPYYTLQYGIVGRPGKDQIESIAVEDGKKYLRQMLEKQGFSVIAFSSEQECLDAVVAHKTDAAAVTTLGYGQLSYHTKYSGLSFRTVPDLNTGMCLAVSKKADRNLLSIIEKGTGVIGNSTVSSLAFSASSVKLKYNLYDSLSMNMGMILAVAILLVGIAFLLLWYRRQRQMNLRLQAAKQAADQANEAKSVFLSNMSHDLRTPLNGILGFADIGLREETAQEKQQCLEKIKLSGDLLLNLVNDTLELSRIESGKMTLEPEAFDCCGVARSVIVSAQGLADEKGVHFIADTRTFPRGIMRADRLKLQKVILNLISNAIKYTPPGGTVRYAVEAINPPVNGLNRRIIVKDTGIGMSPEFLQHLYEPFSQENRLESAGTQGTGLGLSIVKRIVDLMGGVITVESEPGKGTCFTVDLPLECEESAEAVTTEEKAETGTALAGKRILLCEDNQMNTEIALVLLRDRGIFVDTAANGQEGVSCFEKSPVGYYDAILMDIRMPVMDGYAATRAIRVLPRPDAKTVPVLAMTASAFEEDVKKSKAAGMNSHLIKPIDPELLYRAIADACQNRKNHEA